MMLKFYGRMNMNLSSWIVSDLKGKIRWQSQMMGEYCSSCS